jgi:hypothetical protein
MKTNFVLTFSLRVLALALCFICVQQARAGVYLYQGQRALQSGEAQQAAVLAGQGLAVAFYYPELSELRGRALWRRYEEIADQASLEKSRHAFHRLLRLIPDHPRGWFFEALIQREIEKNSPDGITVHDWKRIQKILEHAESRDPQSAWAHFLIAKLTLNQKAFLSEAEIRTALKRLRRALELHDTNQPSSYLAEAMEIVWKEFGDFETLQRIVPEDFYSLNEMVQFAEKKGVMVPEEARQKTEALRDRQYDLQCGKAEDLLRRGYRARAFREYQICSWIDNRRVWAEAGMLAAWDGTTALPGDPAVWLGKIKEDKRESLEFLLPQIQRREAELVK